MADSKGKKQLVGDVKVAKNNKSVLVGNHKLERLQNQLVGDVVTQEKDSALVHESESNVIPLRPASLLASVPVVAATLGTKGLRIQAARKKSLFDNRPSRVGMRTMFSIDFYDTETKEGVSPTNVKVTAVIGTTSVTINLVETTGRIGHYTGSFIPSVSGEWIATANYGATPELVDSKDFYVLPAQ